VEKEKYMAEEQEAEVKFYLRDLPALEHRLQVLGAKISQTRVRETNLRYDTPRKDLARARQTLRLRQDQQARLTFKGPAQSRTDLTVRQEIEFAVSNFEAAEHFLEALGYSVFVRYEKYRTTYELDGLHITLDQLPYGNFVEIEGSEPDGIQVAAEKLGLDWENRVIGSYLSLFATVQSMLNLRERDLTFGNFAGVTVLPDDLGIQYAD
jgi:adenylate cyclase, class 2